MKKVNTTNLAGYCTCNTNHGFFFLGC